MATTANIQIKVDGLAKLQKFREQLWESNKILKSIREDNLNTFNKLTGTIGELNRSLQIATENLQNVKRGTKAQKDEVVNYVTALGQFNKAQAEQNRLIQNEINLREQQAAALKRVKDNSITALPSRKSSTFVQETVSKGRSARIARERSAFLLGEQAYPSPAGPLESRGGTPGFPIALPLPAGQQKALEIQRQKLEIIERTKRTTQELVGIQSGLTKLAQAEATARLEGARDAAQLRGRLAGSPNQYDAPIGPSDVKRRQFQESVAGLRRIRGQDGRGLPPDPKRAGLKKGLTQFADFGLGAGFPLLFGGGAGQVAGGGIGTALGKSLGLASQAVFGLQIAFSAIGDQIEQAIRRIVEMQAAIDNLDMDRLAQTTIYVDENLRSTVNSLIKAGEYAQAYAVATETAAMQTGLLGSQQENIAGTANYLGNAWNRLVSSGSAFLSIVGAPLAAALGGVLDILGFVLKALNGGLTVLGEWITRIPGVKQGLEAIKNITGQTSEENQKLLAQAVERTDSLRSQAILDNKLLELEKQRVAVVDSSIPGAQALADLKNADIELSKKNVTIQEELNKKRAEINKKYAFLAGLQGEALKKGEQQKRIEEIQAEGAAKRQMAEAKLNNERQKGQTLLNEQNRLIDEAIRKLEFQSQLTQQAGQRQANQISNRLRLKEAEYQVESQILQNSIAKAQAAGDYNKVYELRVKKAKLDYEISIERIKTEVRKLEKTRDLARLKLEMLRVAVLETKEGSKQEQRLLEAIKLQKGVLDIAQDNLDAGRKIAEEQKKAANEIKKGAIEAAKLERNMARAAEKAKKVKEEVKDTNDELDKTNKKTRTVSTNMIAITRELEKQFRIGEATKKTGLPEEYFELAEQAERFRKEIDRVKWTDQFGNVVNSGMIERLRRGLELTQMKMKEIADEARNATSEVNSLNAALSRTGKSGGGSGMSANVKAPATYPTRFVQPKYVNGKFIPGRYYASGGYVSSPTDAVIGEGGSEYVIPASKMAAAMERYASGKRGEAVVPNGNDAQVNVSTGPVMQMNGQNYVTQSDFEKGLRSTVSQVMTSLRRSPNTRSSVGI